MSDNLLDDLQGLDKNYFTYELSMGTCVLKWDGGSMRLHGDNTTGLKGFGNPMMVIYPGTFTRQCLGRLRPWMFRMANVSKVLVHGQEDEIVLERDTSKIWLSVDLPQSTVKAFSSYSNSVGIKATVLTLMGNLHATPDQISYGMSITGYVPKTLNILSIRRLKDLLGWKDLADTHGVNIIASGIKATTWDMNRSEFIELMIDEGKEDLL